MKHTLRKVMAVLLVMIMMSGFCTVIGFAEDAPGTTAAADGSDIKDTVDEGLNFFQKISKFFYDFLNFLHEQYLTFVGNNTGKDPFDWMFNGIWFDDSFIWEGFKA